MLASKDSGRSRVVHLDDGTAVIEEMWTRPADRGRGYASGRLQVICDRADADRETLVVSPTPDGSDGMTRGQLESWLIRFGFVPNRGPYADASIAHSMYRRPLV